MLRFAVLSLMVCASTGVKLYGGYDSIDLPVKSYHDMKVIKTPSYREDHKTQVVVKASDMPVYVTFNSQSSPVYVKQQHKGTKGSYHKTDSKDEPHHLVHQVIKPVHQEIIEVIKPYRKVVQVIEPVREERLTKVHKNEGHGGYGGGDGGYGGSDGGFAKGYGGNGGSDGYGKAYDIDDDYMKYSSNTDKKYMRLEDVYNNGGPMDSHYSHGGDYQDNYGKFNGMLAGL